MAIEIATAHGTAVVHRHPASSPRGCALLLHGAGAASGTADLLALAEALAAAGVTAFRLDQPYVVTPGRRPPPPAATLDAVVSEVVAALAGPGTPDAGLPLVLAGRSSGARVACRTARGLGAVGVAALAFPLAPPAGAAKARGIRVAELAGAGVPVLVVQGTRDPFGGPQDLADLGLDGVGIHAIDGADHSFHVRKADGRTPADVVVEVAATASQWLLDQVNFSGT